MPPDLPLTKMRFRVLVREPLCSPSALTRQPAAQSSTRRTPCGLHAGACERTKFAGQRPAGCGSGGDVSVSSSLPRSKCRDLRIIPPGLSTAPGTRQSSMRRLSKGPGAGARSKIQCSVVVPRSTVPATCVSTSRTSKPAFSQAVAVQCERCTVARTKPAAPGRRARRTSRKTSASHAVHAVHAGRAAPWGPAGGSVTSASARPLGCLRSHASASFCTGPPFTRPGSLGVRPPPARQERGAQPELEARRPAATERARSGPALPGPSAGGRGAYGAAGSVGHESHLRVA